MADLVSFSCAALSRPLCFSLSPSFILCCFVLCRPAEELICTSGLVHTGCTSPIPTLDEWTFLTGGLFQLSSNEDLSIRLGSNSNTRRTVSSRQLCLDAQAASLPVCVESCVYFGVHNTACAIVTAYKAVFLWLSDWIDQEVWVLLRLFLYLLACSIIFSCFAVCCRKVVFCCRILTCFCPSSAVACLKFQFVLHLISAFLNCHKLLLSHQTLESYVASLSPRPPGL